MSRHLDKWFIWSSRLAMLLRRAPWQITKKLWKQYFQQEHPSPVSDKTVAAGLYMSQWSSSPAVLLLIHNSSAVMTIWLMCPGISKLPLQGWGNALSILNKQQSIVKSLSMSSYISPQLGQIPHFTWAGFPDRIIILGRGPCVQSWSAACV